MSEQTDNQITLDPNESTAAALVSTIKAAVNGVGKYAAFVETYSVDRENVARYAFALAVLAYPNEKPVQKKDGKRTKFGNAVQAAGNGLRAALGKDESETTETDWLRLMRQAVENASVKGEYTADRIMSEVREVLRGENADLTAVA